MGMLGHAIEVLIAQHAGETTLLEFWLDNEEYLELSNEPGLFAKLKTKKDLLSQIPSAFKHPDGDVEDIAAFIKEFDYNQNYAKFEKAVRKISLDTIASIIVMTVRNLEYSEDKYKCEWEKYTINPYAISSGVEYCQSSYEPEKIIRSLISVDKETNSSGDSNISASAISEKKHKALIAAGSSADLRENEAEVEPFDPHAFEEKMNQIGEQWLQFYGRYITRNPSVIFFGKTFVLSGLEALGDEYELSIENEINQRGGIIRKSISGKTDYLVVDPRWSGESKIKAAVEQISKGKAITVIDGRDLIQIFKTDDDEQITVEESTSIEIANEPELISEKIGLEIIEQEEFDYSINSDGKLYVNNVAASTVLIPDGTQEIMIMAFADSTVSVVKFSPSVKRIGQSAFERCNCLVDIQFNTGLEEIGFSAFGHCSQLQSISIPESVHTIGLLAFTNCESLKDVVIKAPIKQLDRTFTNCILLSQVELPSTLCHIGESVFNSCTSLSNISLPMRLNSIGKNAFGFCKSLEKIVTPIGLASIDENAFEYCTKLKEIHLAPFIKYIAPNSFTNISENATFHVFKGTYGERYCQENGLVYDYSVDPGLLRDVQAFVRARQQRIEKEQIEKQRREKEARMAQEREHQLMIERERQIQMEKQRREEEMRAAQERERQLKIMRARYDKIENEILRQTQIIEKNKGWFGEKAQARKTAQQYLLKLNELMTSEFPNGRP